MRTLRIVSCSRLNSSCSATLNSPKSSWLRKMLSLTWFTNLDKSRLRKIKKSWSSKTSTRKRDHKLRKSGRSLNVSEETRSSKIWSHTNSKSTSKRKVNQTKKSPKKRKKTQMKTCWRTRSKMTTIRSLATIKKNQTSPSQSSSLKRVPSKNTSQPLSASSDSCSCSVRVTTRTCRTCSENKSRPPATKTREASTL